MGEDHHSAAQCAGGKLSGNASLPVRILAPFSNQEVCPGQQSTHQSISDGTARITGSRTKHSCCTSRCMEAYAGQSLRGGVAQSRPPCLA